MESFGKYTSERTAEKVLNDLKKEGYTAKVKTIRGGEYFDVVIISRPKSQEYWERKVTPKTPKLR